MSGGSMYRVQDAEGRGPFKPGMSKYWADEDWRGRENLQPWYAVIKREAIFERLKRSERVGCACETMDDLRAWFTESEIARLERMGYSVIEFAPKRVLFRLPESKQCIVVLP